MMNIQIRRTVRRYLRHYGRTDTRKVIAVIAKGFVIPRQKVAGNLKTMAYDTRPTATINTIVPRKASTIMV